MTKYTLEAIAFRYEELSEEAKQKLKEFEMACGHGRSGNGKHAA